MPYLSDYFIYYDIYQSQIHSFLIFIFGPYMFLALLYWITFIFNLYNHPLIHLFRKLLTRWCIWLSYPIVLGSIFITTALIISCIAHFINVCPTH